MLYCILLSFFRDNIPKLHFTSCFLKESMRMYTPVPAVVRLLKEPVTIEGVLFPVGTVIDVHPHLMHHNPAVWENHTVGFLKQY